MEPPSRLLLEAVARSLRFELEGAGVTTIGPGHSTGWRTLPGCTTAHITGLSLRLERPGLETLRLRSGECFCMPPGQRHNSTVIAGTGQSRWALFSCWVFGSVDLMSLFALPPVLVGAASRRIGELNEAITAVHRAPPTLHGTLRLQAQAFTMIETLIESAPLLPQAQALLLHVDRLAPVLVHIESQLARPLSRAALARIAGLSPSRFHAVFRGAMGIPPLDYILGLRIQRAQHLLISSDLALHEIAERAGFTDPFYFSRLFKRRCGESPARYRRRVRAGLG